MLDHWRAFAGYNAWANTRLYSAVHAMPADAFRRDGGAFFGSLCGTLNHLLVTDLVWMRRFTGEGDAPEKLDAVLFEQLAPLSDARARQDRRIIDWIDGLTPQVLEATISYTRMASPDLVAQPLSSALAHMFNHHAYHRGQAHALVTRFGGEGPVLDLLAYQRETGVAG